MSPKLSWSPANKRTPRGKWLRFRVPDEHMSVKELEDQIEAMVKWCEENDCGRRMSYDMWKFKTKAEMTLFLLRWS
jgi:hypothetical protein